MTKTTTTTTTMAAILPCRCIQVHRGSKGKGPKIIFYDDSISLQGKYIYVGSGWGRLRVKLKKVTSWDILQSSPRAIVLLCEGDDVNKLECRDADPDAWNEFAKALEEYKVKRDGKRWAASNKGQQNGDGALLPKRPLLQRTKTRNEYPTLRDIQINYNPKMNIEEHADEALDELVNDCKVRIAAPRKSRKSTMEALPKVAFTEKMVEMGSDLSEESPAMPCNLLTKFMQATEASWKIPLMEDNEDEPMPTKKIDLVKPSHTIDSEHLKSDRRKESVSQGSNIVGADRSEAWHRSCQVKLPNVAASSINASQAGATMHGHKRNVPPETEANSDQPERTTMLKWNVKKRQRLKKSYGSSTTAHAKEESHCKPAGSKPNTGDTIKANTTMASKKPLIGLPITSRTTTTNSDKDKNNVAKKSAELRTSQTTSSLATATAASRPRSKGSKKTNKLHASKMWDDEDLEFHSS